MREEDRMCTGCWISESEARDGSDKVHASRASRKQLRLHSATVGNTFAAHQARTLDVPLAILIMQFAASLFNVRAEQPWTDHPSCGQIRTGTRPRSIRRGGVA